MSNSQATTRTQPHFNDPKYTPGTSMHPGRTAKGEGSHIQNTLKQTQVMKLTVALLQRKETITSDHPPRMEDLCKELAEELEFPVTEYNILRQIKAGIIPDFRPKKIKQSNNSPSSQRIEELETRIRNLETQVASLNNLTDSLTYYKEKVGKLEETINQVRKDLYTT